MNSAIGSLAGKVISRAASSAASMLSLAVLKLLSLHYLMRDASAHRYALAAGDEPTRRETGCCSVVAATSQSSSATFPDRLALAAASGW
jgi:hypothetical protein